MGNKKIIGEILGEVQQVQNRVNDIESHWRQMTVRQVTEDAKKCKTKIIEIIALLELLPKDKNVNELVKEDSG